MSQFVTGVYCIRNTINGKRYIGSSAESIKGRWNDHRSDLRAGKHGNGHLQRAWNKYGEAAFEFFVLQWCSPEDCIAHEQYWIDWFGVANHASGYNICPKAGNRLGTTHTPEARLKIAAANRARSPDSRERHAEKLRGRKHNPETVAKRAEAMREAWRRSPWTHSPETRAKIGAASRARKPDSPETRAKKGAARRGKPQSAETRAKIGAGNAVALKGRSLPEEVKQKIAVAHKGKAKPWAAKLTLEQIAEIRRRYIRGDPVNGGTALAAEFGVDQSYISRLMSGHRRCDE